MFTIKRPALLFGAAFLLTVAAALFAPQALLFIAIPVSILLAVLGLGSRLATSIAIGCFAAVLCCGVFLLRQQHATQLVGTQLTLEGRLLATDDGQLLLTSHPTVGKLSIRLSPPPQEAENGDAVLAVVDIKSLETSTQSYAAVGGLLLDAELVDYQTLTDSKLPVPLAIHSASLRDRLCHSIAALNPAPATHITLGALFSYRDGIDPSVRADFGNSGMSHLMSVSGLHLSILALGLRLVTARLGCNRWVQLGILTTAMLGFLLLSGISVSATRAVIMTMLGLGAELLHRKADGLTSLSIAAVLLVGACPPLIADLSFLMSYLAVLGILVIAPPVSLALANLWQRLFGGRRPVPRLLFTAVASSLAAQLMVAPVVGWYFGSVPLLGVPINLIAIPLIYPVMILGLLGSALLLLGLSQAAMVLVTAANFFSMLLAFVAELASSLPFCSFATVFPDQWMALGLVLLTLLVMILLPARFAVKKALTIVLGAVALLTTAFSVATAAGSVSIASSTVSGSVVITTADSSIIIDNASSHYQRSRDRALGERIGMYTAPDALLSTYPFDERSRLDGSVEYHLVDSSRVFVTSPHTGYNKLDDEPCKLTENITVTAVAPYCTQIAIGSIKLMKYDGVYDIIIKHGGELPESGAVLVNKNGNLHQPGGRLPIVRRPDGTSYMRITQTGGN